MLKKKVITGTMIMFVSASSSVPVNADATIQEQARNDAQELVLGQRQVDEERLHHCVPEYVNAFLVAFENDAKCYAAAFRQGLADVKNNQQHQYSNIISQTGYQRGYAQGQQLMGRKTMVNDHPTKEPSVFPQPPALDDRQTYQIKQPTINQAAFINRLAGPAQQIGREYDLYPSVIIAQAALESNWGVSTLGRAPYFNIFGIKGYFAGRTINQPTSEYDPNGKKYQINSNFRRYASDYEALKDYAATLAAPLYAEVHRSKAPDYRAATKALVGKYATDPYYNQKLNQLIDTYQLTKYDQPSQNSTHNFQPLPQHEQQFSPVASTFTDHTPKKAAKGERGWDPWAKCLPVIGGVGSVGVIEIIKKLFFK